MDPAVEEAAGAYQDVGRPAGPAQPAGLSGAARDRPGGRRPGMHPQLLRQPGPCTRLTSGDHRLRRPARTRRVTTPHDSARVAEARAWVVRAARDLLAAEHEFHAVPT